MRFQQRCTSHFPAELSRRASWLSALPAGRTLRLFFSPCCHCSRVPAFRILATTSPHIPHSLIFLPEPLELVSPNILRFPLFLFLPLVLSLFSFFSSAPFVRLPLICQRSVVRCPASITDPHAPSSVQTRIKFWWPAFSSPFYLRRRSGLTTGLFARCAARIARKYKRYKRARLVKGVFGWRPER